MYTLLFLMMIATAIVVGKILKAIGKRLKRIGKEEEYERQTEKERRGNNGN